MASTYTNAGETARGDAKKNGEAVSSDETGRTKKAFLPSVATTHSSLLMVPLGRGCTVQYHFCWSAAFPPFFFWSVWTCNFHDSVVIRHNTYSH